jgi:hypothetical protein
MPTFVDRHPLAAVPDATRDQLHLEGIGGLIDAHGVQPLGHWLTDEVSYCVVQAPSPEAFCQHHAERGLPCDEVHLIAGLRGSRPLTGAEAELVRATITERWPADRRAS